MEYPTGCTVPTIFALAFAGLFALVGISSVQQEAVPEPVMPTVIVVTIVPTIPEPALPAPTLAAFPPATLPPVSLPATWTPAPLTVVQTVTPLPALAGAQIIINNVLGWGDLTNEAVEISNQGSMLDLGGWQLSAADGHAFTFPSIQFFGGGLIRVFTRTGADTPIALYWGLDAAIWSAGETVTLSDVTGRVRATFRVGDAPGS